MSDMAPRKQGKLQNKRLRLTNLRAMKSGPRRSKYFSIDNRIEVEY